MATRPERRRPARLRFDPLEPREMPAAPILSFEAGFSPDRLPGGVPAGYASGDLLLTDGPYQARAVFAPTRVDVRAFHTSFTFRVDGPAGPLGDGFTFALTADDTQAAQTAGGAAGGGLGYAGLTNSVAIKFDLMDNAGEGGNSVGVFTGGADPTTPAVNLDGTGIDLHNGHLYQADLAYDGATLIFTLRDFTNTDIPPWTNSFPVDIPAAVGATTAHAGFTAGTGELFARQAIESWAYTEGPEAPGDRPPAITSPARASWLSPGSVALDVGATDDSGPATLTYAWEVVSAPEGVFPRIGPLVGGGSAAVTLNGAGPFTFRATVTDVGGHTATSEVSYFDPLSVTGFAVSAGTDTVRPGETVQFETLVPDASGNPTPEPLAPTWRVVGGPGTIDASGRYTAPIDASGPVTVRAEAPAVVGGHFFTRAAEATITVVGGFEGVDLAGAGSARVPSGILRLADGPYRAGSAYNRTPVDVRGFNTSFWFRVGQVPGFRYGDGLTFVLQNAGPAAVGAAGGGLGYQGITDSVAIKFDLVDNAGEGPQSVGLYTSGAAPTVPADPLPAPPPGQGNGGLLLNTGHVFRADLTYAGGELTLRLSDTITGHAFTRTYAVDIPAAVGAPTALAGFTAGTGELFAPIDVLKWTYAPADNPEPPPPIDGAPAVTVDVGVGTGIITTVAGGGTGGDGGPATAAGLGEVHGLAVDAAGNLFVTDRSTHRIRRVDAGTGVITTVAGNGTRGDAGDGGPATAASLNDPTAVALDAAGDLFIADTFNHRVRRVDAATGVITTVAGTGTAGDGGDGGPAASAALNDPDGVAVDAGGNVYIADTQNHRVRRVDARTGVITTVAGTGVRGFDGGDAPATQTRLSFPSGLALDAAGDLFIVDTGNQIVRRVDATSGVLTTVAGTGGRGDGLDNVPATESLLFDPSAVAVDAAGDLFIADTHSSRIRRVDASTGMITTVAGIRGGGLVIDGGLATGSSLGSPGGVAVDAAGNVYIADTFNHRVRRVGSGAVLEGNRAAYTFTIRNVSPATTDPVTVTTVWDDMLGDLTAAALAANGGDAVVGTGRPLFFRHVTGPLNAGLVEGIVAVTGHDDEGIPATANAGHTLFVADVPPEVAVHKAGPDSVPGGQAATFEFTITNTSPARTDPVTVSSIADDRLGELIDAARAANGGADVVLAPGQRFTFSAGGPAPGPGTVVTTVTVTAHDDEGTTATASDTETLVVR